LRLAPGQDVAAARAALIHHLESHVPWGAQVSVTPGSMGEPFALATSGPAYEAFRSAFAAAWGRPTVEMGVGGSIPFVAAFAARYPDATILLTGIADDKSRAHGPDESVDLDDLRRGILAEAIALRLLADA
jgi:acetylornithine deacetylase/succinyl-diaminopimelate desuccinylase-like protein